MKKKSGIKYAIPDIKGRQEARARWEADMKLQYEIWNMHYDAGWVEGFKRGCIVMAIISVLITIFFNII